jgi:hypothetical protein
MKAKKFQVKITETKARGHIAPASRAHKDKRNDYNRKNFKNSNNWE